MRYHEFLVDAYDGSSGLADLVAFFLRRAFGLLRRNGAFGLIATNTVAQGDTRVAGLQHITSHGGFIFSAEKRFKWPGEAAVVVSVVHVLRGLGPVAAFLDLDGRSVGHISSFLLAGNAEGPPRRLAANAARCYLGAKVWGAGFIFEPQPANGSSSLDDMRRLLETDPRNREVIFPYIGGEEFNEGATQAPVRFVIDFGRMPIHEARQWPKLFELVEERVRPIRATNKQRNYREEWWLHANRADEVAPYLEQHGRVLALSSVSKHLAVSFVSRGTVAANTLLLICLHGDGDLAVLQSRVHDVWTRITGSSLEDRLRYTTDCFDTFPRPASTPQLDESGGQLRGFRAALMEKNDEGLTKTYNRFHDPDERAPEIVTLRSLHDAMDRAVLDAYGWTDIKPTCTFLLEYEDDEHDEDDGGKRKKKKPWRYRWPDDVRDEVLARLMKLNAERYAEEQRFGTDKQLAAAAASRDDGSATKSPTKKKATRTKTRDATPDLFGASRKRPGGPDGDL